MLNQDTIHLLAEVIIVLTTFNYEDGQFFETYHI